MSRIAAAEMAEQARNAKRIAEGDALTTLAELAADLEELLISNEASPATVVDRLRYHTEAAGLTTIGQAGKTTAYDPARHSLLGDAAAAGTPVVVLRPGHLYRDTLIAKAIVCTASPEA